MLRITAGRWPCYALRWRMPSQRSAPSPQTVPDLGQQHIPSGCGSGPAPHKEHDRAHSADQESYLAEQDGDHKERYLHRAVEDRRISRHRGQGIEGIVQHAPQGSARGGRTGEEPERLEQGARFPPHREDQKRQPDDASYRTMRLVGSVRL